MAAIMTLAEVRLAARQRADMENSQFVADSEWNQLIAQSYFELYDLLVQKYGNDYFVAEPVTITADGTSDRFSLPNGTLYSSAPAFYKVLGVDVKISNTADNYVALKNFTFADRNRLQSAYVPEPYGSSGYRYRVTGDKLWISPRAQSGQQFRLWYVPRLTPPTADASTLDGISGWTEYVIVDAAIKALQKEESDVSVLLAQKVALIRRIEAAAENRDAANPQRVTDTSDEGGWGDGWQ